MAAPLKRTRRRQTQARKSKTGAPTPPSGAPSRPPKARLAGEVWEAMVHAVFARRDHMAQVAAKLDLTLPQAQVLQLLQRGPARTMNSIAQALACDASNVTGIVDRLETRRLITRGNSKHDRRITTIALTKRGKEVQRELTCGFLEPPEVLYEVSRGELRRLHGIVIRAFGHWPDDLRCRDVSSAER